MSHRRKKARAREEDSAQKSNARKTRRRRSVIVALILAIFHLLGLVSAAHAVMTVRTPQGAIAWGVSLIAFPYAAVPAYWVFGRSEFNGYVSARATGGVAFHSAVDALAESSVRDYVIPEASLDPGLKPLSALAQLPFSRGNSAELLIDGEATFDSIFEGIASAKDYVLAQFYIIHDDGLGQRFKNALIEKAGQGVEVYLLYDEMGSLKTPGAYWQELRDAGVFVSPFNSRKGPTNRFQFNFRNHRKVVVVDGKRAWVGGANIGDEYMGLDPEFGHWRDTQVRIDGPAAIGVQVAFLEDWYWAEETVPDLTWEVTEAAPENLPVLVLPTAPEEVAKAELFFLHCINEAKERLWIASPYFVPDEGMVSALRLAALRGVDVRVLIPENPDHLMVFFAAFSYLKDLGDSAVKFYRYTEGFLHQKVILVDDSLAGIGTANFDNRSFRLNFEITILINDEGFAKEVETMLLADMEGCQPAKGDELDRKSYMFRMGVQGARLFAPIL